MKSSPPRQDAWRSLPDVLDQHAAAEDRALDARGLGTLARDAVRGSELPGRPLGHGPDR